MKILAKVRERLPNARLLVLGKKADFDRYVGSLADQLGVRRRVVVTDWLAGDELRLAYAATDVVVTPSTCLDTFGLVNLEAMNFRKPVVGTLFGGTPEVVDHGTTGYVENPFDVGAYASRVVELLEDGDLRRAMGDAGHARLLERFTMPRLARDVLAIYRAGRRPAALHPEPTPGPPRRKAVSFAGLRRRRNLGSGHPAIGGNREWSLYFATSSGAPVRRPAFGFCNNKSSVRFNSRSTP